MAPRVSKPSPSTRCACLLIAKHRIPSRSARQPVPHLQRQVAQQGDMDERADASIALRGDEDGVITRALLARGRCVRVSPRLPRGA